jgi:hypothetical protein
MAMSRAETDAYLRDRGTGTLSLAAEGEVDHADETLVDDARFVSVFRYRGLTTERPRYRLAVKEATGQSGQGYDT